MGSHTHLSRQSALEIRHVVSAEKIRFFVTGHSLIKLGWFTQRKAIVQTGTNAGKPLIHVIQKVSQDFFSGCWSMKSGDPAHPLHPLSLSIRSVGSGCEVKHLQHCLPPPWYGEPRNSSRGKERWVRSFQCKN